MYLYVTCFSRIDFNIFFSSPRTSEDISSEKIGFTLESGEGGAQDELPAGRRRRRRRRKRREDEEEEEKMRCLLGEEEKEEEKERRE